MIQDFLLLFFETYFLASLDCIPVDIAQKNAIENIKINLSILLESFKRVLVIPNPLVFISERRASIPHLMP